MFSLYYDGYLRDVEQDKAKDPALYHITGANIFASQVLPALCRYAQIGSLLMPFLPDRRPSQVGDSAGLITYVNQQNRQIMRDYDDLILFTPTPIIHSLAKLRRRAGVPHAPIMGFIHSTNDDQFVEYLSLAVTAQLRDYDVIVASSNAGRISLERQWETLVNNVSSDSRRITERPNVAVVPIGVELAEWNISSEDRFLARDDLKLASDECMILFLGRISRRSKADLLPFLSVIRSLSRKTRCKVVIAGDDRTGLAKEGLSRIIRELELSDVVTVLTNLDARCKKSCYAAADIFVSPSDNVQETFGQTIVEAMAAGLPVIAADWSGYKEIIDDGETGFLVQSFMPYLTSECELLASGRFLNDVDVLSTVTGMNLRFFEQALEILCRSVDRRRDMGRAARRRVEERYDWQVVVHKYEELWKGSLSKAGGRAELRSGPSTPWSHYETFKHFPSETLSGDTRWELGMNYQDPAIRKLLISELEKMTLMQSGSCFEAVLTLIDDAGVTTINELSVNEVLSGMVRDDRLSQRTVVTMLVLQLAKYGLVEKYV